MSRLSVLIILVSLPFISSSQTVNDARLWSSFDANKKIDHFTFSIEQNMRLDENMSHIDKVFTELEVEYELLKGFEIGFKYRLSRDNDYSERAYDLRHRFDFSIGYKDKFGNLRCAVRNKLQTKTADRNSNNPTYNRTKFTVKYDLDKDFEPYSYYEFFYQFNDENIINRTRLSFGVKYDINKDNAFKVFYIFENRFNRANLAHNHIWGVSYSLDL